MWIHSLALFFVLLVSQLGPGTSFNTTLNLTGHILLGLGIASSILAFIYIRSFVMGSKGAYSQDYYYDTSAYRRKVISSAQAQLLLGW